MLPSDAIRVLEHDPSRVVIVDPPYYSFGFYLLVVAACIGGLAYVLITRHAIPPLAWMLVLTAAMLGAFASYLLTSRRTITVSTGENQLKIENAVWGIRRTEAILRLDEVRRAAVETVHFNRSIVVILKSGEPFAITNGSDRRGYYGAVEAMNQVIEGSPR